MKKFLLLAGAVGAFLVGYGASASFAAYPSGGIHGRGEHNGYFTNANDDMGSAVLRQVYDGEAIRPDVNDAAAFITFIKHTKLDIDGNGSGDTRDKTGAAFIIHTMLGSSTSARSRPPTAAQIAEWEARVNYLDRHGKVSWRTNYSFTINSYWQATDGGGSNPNDDAFYDENGTKPSIVFRNMSNQVVYAIKWECANPVGTGSLGPVPNNPEFNMYGATSLNNTTPAPGDTIQFHHRLQNTNTTYATSPDTIAWRVYSGTSAATMTTATAITGNAGTFAANQSKPNLGTENVTVPINAAPGSQICRRIQFTPDTQNGGTSYSTGACATVQYNYDLNPIINIQVNGGAPVGSTAEAGDSISFTYLVTNSGTTVSESTNCNIYRNERTGAYTPPSPPTASNTPSPFTQPAHGCPRSYPVGSTTLVTETVASAAANTTYCRTFLLARSEYGVNVPKGVEQCIKVVAKPYLKVFGGDVMAGSGFETAPSTCSSNTNAQLTAWNRRSANAYAGAGAQYAVTALNRIGDFASGQRAGASAPTPNTLSFASTTSNPATGNFGGSFGSVPCIKDYWAGYATSLPDASSTTVSSMGTGVYKLGAGQSIGGNINPGQRTILYVNGNLRITSNISYPGSWSTTNTPSFLLVVKGNIYIDPAVTQISGNIVAQGDGTITGGGIIYTCAGSATQPALGLTMYSDCDNKLTVNGSFTANKIEFLRTSGSLNQSDINEGPGDGSIAEEFNYSPANWMSQPPVNGDSADYDAITSLPPIL
jgi:hypothetical protein